MNISNEAKQAAEACIELSDIATTTGESVAPDIKRVIQTAIDSACAIDAATIAELRAQLEAQGGGSYLEVQKTCAAQNRILTDIRDVLYGDPAKAAYQPQTKEGKAVAELTRQLEHSHRLESSANQSCARAETVFATLTAERDALRAEVAELSRQRDAWKASHDNQVKLRRILMDRTDLGDRARSMQKLIAERDAALAKVAALQAALKKRIHFTQWPDEPLLTTDPGELGADSARQWRPIASAPKNGSEVLLITAYRGVVRGRQLVGHWMPGGHCIEDHPAIDEGWYFWNGRMFDKATLPTHWQPLPEPPAGEGAK